MKIKAGSVHASYVHHTKQWRAYCVLSDADPRRRITVEAESDSEASAICAVSELVAELESEIAKKDLLILRVQELQRAETELNNCQSKVKDARARLQSIAQPVQKLLDKP